MPKRTRRLTALLLAAGSAAVLAACGSSSGGGDPPPPTTTAQAARHIALADVKRLAAPRWAGREHCADGRWTTVSAEDRSTDSDYAGMQNASELESFDCFDEADDPAPYSGDEVVWAVLPDAASAKAAAAQQKSHSLVVDDRTVLISGGAILDYGQYAGFLEQVRKTCGGCGALTGDRG